MNDARKQMCTNCGEIYRRTQPHQCKAPIKEVAVEEAKPTKKVTKKK